MIIEMRAGKYGRKKPRKWLTTRRLPIQTVDNNAATSKALVKVTGFFALANKAWRSLLVNGLIVVMYKPSQIYHRRSVQKVIFIFS
jgi:hypothetical protein